MAENGYDITLMVDGGSRGNPGPAAIGAVLRQEGTETICLSEYIGEATNNEAEYMALIIGLRKARDMSAHSIHVKADSMLMVKQLLGQFKIRSENIKPLHAEATAMLKAYTNVGIEHIPRELNSEADALVNEALDAATGKTKKKRLSGDKSEPCPKATGPIISFLSDLGLNNAQVAIHKAGMKGYCPTVDILDITHMVEANDIRGASQIMESAVPYINAMAHLAIVFSPDGVNDRGVAISTVRGDYLVGPDNGLLIAAAEKLGGIKSIFDIGDTGNLLQAAVRLASGEDPLVLGHDTSEDALVRLSS